jgi:hypothetical protein
MGRERFLFLPFPRPVGPPFRILTYIRAEELALFTRVRGRGILRVPLCRSSRKFTTSRGAQATAKILHLGDASLLPTA